MCRTLLQEAFPEYPELLKMAVCLARQMQEPIHEFSALMNSDEEEIFALRIHPLQDALPKDKLKTLLEIELVTRVNDVGVDVHFLMEHPHASDTLTYICGLGPRKAAALLKVCVSSSRVHNTYGCLFCQNYHIVENFHG